MEHKLRDLIIKLREENAVRSVSVIGGKCTEYEHTVLVHNYNNTLDIIRQLELILE